MEMDENTPMADEHTAKPAKKPRGRPRKNRVASEAAPVERAPRSVETREHEERPTGWRPPSLLPTPAPQDGYRFRWIRTSTFGETDNKNVSARMREGWVPVRATDHPELQIRSDKGSDFPDGIEVGGLLLCKTAIENVKQRNEYFRHRSRDQMESVDNAYLRVNDPRMPLLKPERRSRTSLGQRPEDGND